MSTMLHLGIVILVVGQKRGQDMPGIGAGRAQLEGAAAHHTQLIHHLLGFVMQAEYLFGVAHEHFTGLGEHQFLAQSGE
jgi:hypothetical protein